MLTERFQAYLEGRISLGEREMRRTAGEASIHRLAKEYYDTAVDQYALFTGRYDRDLVNVFAHFQRKGRLELLCTAATNSFLPFYTNIPEAVQSQIELALGSHRCLFERKPHGFWLPEMGWSNGLDSCLKAYDFSYTVVDSHGLLAAGARFGTFFPAITPKGIMILGRDYTAHKDIWDEKNGIALDPAFLDSKRDLGFELAREDLLHFIDSRGSRTPTGCGYWQRGTLPGQGAVYEPELAKERVLAHARAFLENRISRLKSFKELTGRDGISLCVFEASSLGKRWREGPLFLEALFREGGVQFTNPEDYLFKQNSVDYQTLSPGFSSCCGTGYAEAWLDASNDWIYRHIFRSLDRMTELAERFPCDTGLKERALNQAAREILLVQECYWPQMMSIGRHAGFARSQIENSLRNFTTIYEALGSNYISTEWLTAVEKQNNLFPNINYRVFQRKK
jgi:1,4-alpha-glucan branching enzyme